MGICKNKLTIIGLFWASLFIFVWPNPFNEIIGFESRFYLFAMNMWQDGFSWFPTTYHQPYPDYPGTSTWVIYGLATLFGHLTKWIAVLPNAIAASITIVLTYLIGNLHSKHWGWGGVLFLYLTITFLKCARSLSLDIYPLLFTTWSFYLVYSADVKKTGKTVWWVYIFMLLSFAFRGPIGVVMPAGVVCVYYLLNKNIKQCIVSGLIALGILIVSTLGLLALAQHVGGAAFKADVLRMQVLGRIDNPYLPFYFYFTSGVLNNALSYPFAYFTVAGMAYYALRRIGLPYQQALWQLLGWSLVILIGMSIPDDKKIRYILPMLPAAALLAAYPFTVINGQKYFTSIRKIGMTFFLFFPAMLFIATIFLYSYQHQKLSGLIINYSVLWSLLILLQLVNFWFAYRQKMMNWVLPIAAASFVIVYINVIERIELYIDRASDFVTTIEQLRAEQKAELVFYKERPDGLPIKYLVNASVSTTPVFIEDQSALNHYKSKAFFVTSDEYFQSLPKEMMSYFHIIANDTLGHNHVVVFTQRSK